MVPWVITHPFIRMSFYILKEDIMSKIFDELSKDSEYEREQKILEKWKSEDILDKTIQNRKDNENFVFYDGPATANGNPGVHHM